MSHSPPIEGAPNSGPTPAQRLEELEKEVRLLKNSVQLVSAERMNELKQELETQQKELRFLESVLSLYWLSFRQKTDTQSEFDRRVADSIKEATLLYFNQIKLDPAQWTNLASF